MMLGFSLLILLILVLVTQMIVNRSRVERFNQELQHLTPHFGGVPNASQVWGYMVKYPKAYV